MANKKRTGSPIIKKPLSLSSNAPALLIFVAILAGIGAYFILSSQAKTDNAVRPFVENRQRGLVWKGLRTPKTDSKCQKLLEVVDRAGEVVGCTHGPDPVPPGLDATVSVEPLANGDETTPTTATASGIPCDGDGATGPRVQLLYVRAADKPDRYDQFANSFPQYAAVMNNAFVESSLQNGGTLRQIRFDQNPTTCEPTVVRAVVSATGDDNIANTRAELRAQGYSRADRHYLVWMDSLVYGGIAYIQPDDRPGVENANNGGSSFARVDSGNWGGYTEAHEIMHTFGAVQLSAPHVDNYHCTDSLNDRMCYSGSRTLCKGTAVQFDCNKDDYFNTSESIPLSNYLASHWNTANSLYLIKGGAVPPVAPDTVPPTVNIGIPVDGSAVGSRVTIGASANDNTGVVKMEVYIDGSLRSASSNGSISYTWNSSKASRGIHTILVKAYDAAGNVGQSSIGVIK